MRIHEVEVSLGHVYYLSQPNISSGNSPHPNAFHLAPLGYYDLLGLNQTSQLLKSEMCLEKNGPNLEWHCLDTIHLMRYTDTKASKARTVLSPLCFQQSLAQNRC